VRITVCGTRGSTPAPGRDFLRYGGHTSCLAFTADGAACPELLLDAGTGIREVTALLTGAPFRGAIALTHLHWDHMQGLPFFRGGDHADARARLLLPEPEGGQGALAALERCMSPPSFPITPRQLRGDWTFEGLQPGQIQLGRFSLLAREIPHKGGRTFGYRVSDGRRAVAYLPDHSPTDLGPGPDGLGAYHEAAVELAAGADILMHDSFWLAGELDPAQSFGHACAEYAVGLAARAGASRVMLVHHRPDRSDAELDKLAAGFTDSPVPVAVAFEGEVICL
jgi:phosphoribosyl 1,2-cyclic phosphodiesterase